MSVADQLRALLEEHGDVPIVINCDGQSGDFLARSVSVCTNVDVDEREGWVTLPKAIVRKGTPTS